MVESRLHINNGFKMRINFNLKAISGTKSQIWLSTTIDGKRVRVYTRLLIEPHLWVKSERNNKGGGCAIENTANGRVVNRRCKEINQRLKEILNFCSEYMNEVSSQDLQTNELSALTHSADNFKAFMEDRIQGRRVERANVETFVEEFIKRKSEMTNKSTGRKICEGTIYNHTNALERLRTYAKENSVNIVWDMFTKEFEDDFTAWMLKQGFSPNTVSSQYSIMKVWLSNAEEKGLISNKAFYHYTTRTYNVENIYLNDMEIKMLYDLDLSDSEVNSQSKIEETRDLFIVGCWTGLRYSDYSHLPEIDEATDTVRVHTQKTGKTVVIPLHPQVKAIYKKYGGCLPKPIDRGKAIKNLRYCAKLAGLNEHTILTKVRGGKDVLDEGEKWSHLVNHTARRSFATNMFLREVPIESIMAITGHTSEENFRKYIKVSPEQHAEVVAKAFINDKA